MKRTLSVERLYNLGQFINIKIINTIEDVPEDIAEDGNKIQMLYKSLAAECDIAYQEYKDLNADIKNAEEGKTVKELLVEERDRIAKELAHGE